MEEIGNKPIAAMKEKRMDRKQTCCCHGWGPHHLSKVLFPVHSSIVTNGVFSIPLLHRSNRCLSFPSSESPPSYQQVCLLSLCSIWLRWTRRVGYKPWCYEGWCRHQTKRMVGQMRWIGYKNNSCYDGWRRKDTETVAMMEKMNRDIKTVATKDEVVRIQSLLLRWMTWTGCIACCYDGWYGQDT